MVKRMSTKEKIKANKNAVILLVLALAFVVIAARYAELWSTNLGGGTIWQFDYEWANIDFQGEIASEFFTTNNAVVLGAGTWLCDPDGPLTVQSLNPPIVEGYQAGLQATVSLAGRVNRYGEEWDDFLDIVEESDEVLDPVTGEAIRTYRYYYAFEVKFETEQDMWTGGVPQTTVAEMGEMVIIANLRLIFDKSVFTSNITAYAADCKVADDGLDYTDVTSYIPEYYWWEEPFLDIVYFPGNRVDLSAETDETDYKTAIITLGCTMNPGRTRASLIDMNARPFGVFLETRLIVTMLQEQPFVIGHESDIETPQPPHQPNPWGDFLNALPLIGLFAFILIITIVVGVVLVMYYWQKRSQTNVYVSAGGRY